MSHATPPQIGAVVALWRYPVKSMQGEALQIAQVRDHGLLGDRAYALLDRADGMVTSNRPTLYERLGGVYRIATVVDDLIDWVMDDPRLNANPRVDEAHHRVSATGFKYLVTEMVCWASGGPQQSSGRSMRESHQDLRMTAAEWDAFLGDVQHTLDTFGVPQAEQEELKALVASTRAGIVV